MKLAILSRDRTLYSTKRIVKRAIELGHQIIVIDALMCNLIMENNHPQIYYGTNHKLDYIDAIIPRIGTSVTAYGSAVVRQFEMMNVCSSLDSNALLRSRDKLRSMQVLSRENIDFPKTVYTNTRTDVKEVLKSVGGVPVVVKSLQGTQGLGVMLLESERAAVSVIEAFNCIKAETMVQEFIGEAKGADIRAFVIDGKVVGAMKRQGAEGEFRSNLHRGGSAEVIELTDVEQDYAIRATEALGLEIAGVDMLQSSRGPLILEVNSSPGLEGIEKATGEDIAGEIIKFVERKFKVEKRIKANG